MTGRAIAKHLNVALRPVADAAAVVRAPGARFTVLTSRLIRMEHSAGNEFEDHASQAFWYREQPPPEFQVSREGDRLEIVTAHLRLSYTAGPRGFRADTLSVELMDGGAVWRYGDRDWKNLRGTARTVDNADGPVRLDAGLVSRSGWAVVDDSASLVFDEDGWIAARAHPDNLDLYFFGYGHDYVACLQDFCRVSGPVPLIPRWALGNWWSRYWEYSQAELAELMLTFQRRGVPLSVCIIDMDWHITRTGNTSSGWTGYTWNRDLFPDPRALLDLLHWLGLKVSLNLHPAAGVHPHEEQYPAMAHRLGLDPAGQEPIAFDIGDPQFAAAYLEILHHPLESQGVDFWWVDWQQGSTSRHAGLDPLWWLNHLHFYDLGRDGVRRPFVFSRWGGLGSHRYPIGFSGDAVVSWNSLSFQPYFTATAANVAFGWWSHDIGGHMMGIEDRELYTRWVQFGVFSPILRLHSTKNAYHERRPWGYDAEVCSITESALRLRHALLPYLYTMAWRAASDSLPLVLPMYSFYPEHEEAYHCPTQYLFGSELIAAPFVAPRDEHTRLSSQRLWLPPGDWYDFQRGDRYPGGRWHTLYGGLDAIPVLARAGAIVPMDAQQGADGSGNPQELSIHVFAGADNRLELYEDDGETQAHLAGHRCLTPIVQEWHEQRLRLSVGPAQGDTSVLPAGRTIRLLVHGIRPPDRLRLSVGDQDREGATSYDEATDTLAVDAVVVAPGAGLALACEVDDGGLLSPADHRAEACRDLLRAFRLDTDAKRDIDRALPALVERPALLMNHSAGLHETQLAALSHVLGRCIESGC